MQLIILATIAIPLICALVFVVTGLSKTPRENFVSHTAFSAVVLLCAQALFCFAYFLANNLTANSFTYGVLYHSVEYAFPLSLILDGKAIALLLVTAFAALVVVKFARYYLHKEEGYHRFFATIFLFIGGMNLLAIANTLDLFFVAWEIIGISSFLLIAFYYQRQLPVKHALLTFGVYRVADVGLFLGAYVYHLIFRENLFFDKLAVIDWSSHNFADSSFSTLLGLLLLFAAVGKSAQIPFCFWLPKAMEGPTPSSAIFYGGLSIHAGVFLMLRTFPIWSHKEEVRLLVGLVGLFTAFVASAAGRAQSNIKGQIAYASITQVGFMFLELGLGWERLVIFHLLANALLRCYQLLISPSAVAELLRLLATPGAATAISDWSVERILPQRWRSSLYVFALNEGYLEAFVKRVFVRRMQILADAIYFLVFKTPWQRGLLLLGIMGVGLWAGVHLHSLDTDLMICVFIVLAATCSLLALGEKISAERIWTLVGTGLVLSSFTLLMHSSHFFDDSLIFLTGIGAWLLGYYLMAFPERDHYRYGFFVCCLALIGFPLFPTFLGEELLLHAHSSKDKWLVAFIAAQFILNGVIIMRLHAAIFLSQVPAGLPGSSRLKPKTNPLTTSRQ